MENVSSTKMQSLGKNNAFFSEKPYGIRKPKEARRSFASCSKLRENSFSFARPTLVKQPLGVSKKQYHRITETAYYQAGKIVVQTLLPEQPPVALIALNTFGITSSTSVDTYIPIESNSQCCSFLESRLISLYGGKAASSLIEYQYEKKRTLAYPLAKRGDPRFAKEAQHPVRSFARMDTMEERYGSTYGSKIYCAGTGNNIFQSTIGNLEIQLATRLATIMVNYWNFYSSSLHSKTLDKGRLKRTFSHLTLSEQGVPSEAKDAKRSFALALLPSEAKDPHAYPLAKRGVTLALPRRGMLREIPLLTIFDKKYLRFIISKSKNSLKNFKSGSNKRTSYIQLRTSVENIGKNSSKIYSQVGATQAFQAINSLQFSNLHRNRFYPGWFRLYLPDVEVTQYFKNVTNHYFSLGLQTLTRPSWNELILQHTSVYAQKGRYQTGGLRQIANFLVFPLHVYPFYPLHFVQKKNAIVPFAKQLQVQSEYEVALQETFHYLQRTSFAVQHPVANLAKRGVTLAKLRGMRGVKQNLAPLGKVYKPTVCTTKDVYASSASFFWTECNGSLGLQTCGLCPVHPLHPKDALDVQDAMESKAIANRNVSLFAKDKLCMDGKTKFLEKSSNFLDTKYKDPNITNLNVGVGLLRNSTKQQKYYCFAPQIEYRKKMLPFLLANQRFPRRGNLSLPSTESIESFFEKKVTQLRPVHSVHPLHPKDALVPWDAKQAPRIPLSFASEAWGNPSEAKDTRFAKLAKGYVMNTMEPAHPKGSLDEKGALDISLSLLLEKDIFPINSTCFPLIEKHLLYHSLVNNCFAKAFYIVNQNRQLLDFFADYLLRFQIIRQHQILYLFSAILLGCK